MPLKSIISIELNSIELRSAITLTKFYPMLDNLWICWVHARESVGFQLVNLLSSCWVHDDISVSVEEEVKKFMYLTCHSQDTTQGQFFKQTTAGLNSFFENNTLPELKGPDCSTRYPSWGEVGVYSYFFQGHWREVKCKHHRSGFELGSPISYPMTLILYLLDSCYHRRS